MKAAIAGVWLVLCLAATAPPPAFAQEPPKITSPEVRADRTVVFRFWAPRATEVHLSGSWMGPTPPVPLVKGTDGVWTVQGARSSRTFTPTDSSPTAFAPATPPVDARSRKHPELLVRWRP